MTTSNTITVVGYSDDYIVVEGHKDGDQFDCYNRDVLLTFGGPDGGLLLRMSYAPDKVTATWQATVGQIDDGVPIPWPVSVVHHNIRPNEPYFSVEVRIDAPADVPMAVAKVRGMTVPEVVR